MSALIEDLLRIDTNLFLYLNQMHSQKTDFMIRMICMGQISLPFYVALLIASFKTCGEKALLISAVIIAASLLAVGFTSGIMKPYFMRVRPCSEPALRGLVHQVLDCDGSFSFASTQASASFAFAVAWFRIYRTRFRWAGLLLLWAGFISCCRIFAGLHYPADIMAGALIGTLAGFLCTSLARHTLHLPSGA